MALVYEAGAHIGRFVLEAEIGRGSTGVVYRALDPVSQRVVAERFGKEPRRGVRGGRAALGAREVVGRALEAGRAEVEMSRHLERSIAERLGKSQRVLAEPERFRRMPSDPEIWHR